MKNLLTFDAFADFCERQPKRKHYEYFDDANCACAQYAQSLGVHYGDVRFDRPGGRFWQRVEMLAYKGRHTFGALAKRLRAEAQ